jgi:hypothetical protein
VIWSSEGPTFQPFAGVLADAIEAWLARDCDQITSMFNLRLARVQWEPDYDDPDHHY